MIHALVTAKSACVALWCTVALVSLTGCGGSASSPTASTGEAAPPPAPAASELRPQAIESGIHLYEARIPVLGHPSRIWIYLPDPRPRTPIPVVLIAPAGTRLFHGMELGEGDRPEHLPYVHAGMGVVAYELNGSLSDGAGDAQVIAAARAFKEAEAGLDNAREALKFALKSFPVLDPKRVYAAGHSSAATTALLLGQTEPQVRACAAFAPACYVPERLGGQVIRALDGALPGYGEFIQRVSPATHAERLRCPTFLFHAQDDTNVPPAEVTRFAAAVRRVNPNLTLVTVPSGGHYDSMIREGVPRAIRWFQSLSQRR